MRWQHWVPSGGSRVGWIWLPFPASRSHPHSLASGSTSPQPLHLSGYLWLPHLPFLYRDRCEDTGSTQTSQNNLPISSPNDIPFINSLVYYTHRFQRVGHGSGWGGESLCLPYPWNTVICYNLWGTEVNTWHTKSWPAAVSHCSRPLTKHQPLKQRAFLFTPEVP